MLHSNVRPHTAAHTVESLPQMKFQVLKHPPCSPDLASPGFHQFLPLNDALRGCHFASDQQIKEAVHAWLVTQPKTFFLGSIQKLVDRWGNIVETDGDYTENDAIVHIHCNCIKKKAISVTGRGGL
jgi:histone-lysine N-methyltransferase SETMAR